MLNNDSYIDIDEIILEDNKEYQETQEQTNVKNSKKLQEKQIKQILEKMKQKNNISSEKPTAEEIEFLLNNLTLENIDDIKSVVNDFFGYTKDVERIVGFDDFVFYTEELTNLNAAEQLLFYFVNRKDKFIEYLNTTEAGKDFYFTTYKKEHPNDFSVQNQITDDFVKTNSTTQKKPDITKKETAKKFGFFMHQTFSTLLGDLTVEDFSSYVVDDESDIKKAIKLQKRITNKINDYNKSESNVIIEKFIEKINETQQETGLKNIIEEIGVDKITEQDGVLKQLTKNIYTSISKLSEEVNYENKTTKLYNICLDNKDLFNEMFELSYDIEEFIPEDRLKILNNVIDGCFESTKLVKQIREQFHKTQELFSGEPNKFNKQQKKELDVMIEKLYRLTTFKENELGLKAKQQEIEPEDLEQQKKDEENLEALLNDLLKEEEEEEQQKKDEEEIDKIIDDIMNDETEEQQTKEEKQKTEQTIDKTTNNIIEKDKKNKEIKNNKQETKHIKIKTTIDSEKKNQTKQTPIISDMTMDIINQKPKNNKILLKINNQSSSQQVTKKIKIKKTTKPKTPEVANGVIGLHSMGRISKSK